MNIFESLKFFVKKKTAKLLFDSQGNAYLYHYESNKLEKITLYSSNEFRPPIYYQFKYKFEETDDEHKKREDSLDKLKVYSIPVTIKENGEDKLINRYGFISESGYAITHATYDKVEAFQNGQARVFLNDESCYIDVNGCPILNGKPFSKAEFVFKSKCGFVICCTNGKYGLINKYMYLCLPCEYDAISIKNTFNVNYVSLKKNDCSYTAIIDNNAICNILNYTPQSIKLIEDFLIIEEKFPIGKDFTTKFGLLNRGGIRILNSEYDTINIVASNIGLVSKGELTQVLFIGEEGFQECLRSNESIKYGEAYDDKRGVKFSYVSIGEKDIQFLESEDKEGLHDESNTLFAPVDTDEYDSLYFESRSKSNNYIAVVVGSKTKLVDIYGEEVIPLVIPSEYKVVTDTYSEGIVGISKKELKKNSDGELYEEVLYSYINSEGKILTDFMFDEISKFENGQAKACYYFLHGFTECIIDKNGKIIHKQSEYDSDCEPQEDYLDEWMDDAFEGDPDAYWNID